MVFPPMETMILGIVILRIEEGWDLMALGLPVIVSKCERRGLGFDGFGINKIYCMMMMIPL